MRKPSENQKSPAGFNNGPLDNSSNCSGQHGEFYIAAAQLTLTVRLPTLPPRGHKDGSIEGVETGGVWIGVVGSVMVALGGDGVGVGVCPTNPEERLAMRDVFSVRVIVLTWLEFVQENAS